MTQVLMPRAAGTSHAWASTDSALLEVSTEETPVVTVDLGLYLAASTSNPDSAINFTHAGTIAGTEM